MDIPDHYIDGYPPRDNTWAIGEVMKFIQISRGYSQGPSLNGGVEDMPIEEAARIVYDRWYRPR